MAYGLKYQSTVYSKKGHEIIVSLYQNGYIGSVSPLIVKSVNIINNYQDEDTGVIGTGAKIVIINNGNLMTYEDLLGNYEKQFKCKIEWDNTVVFEGYLICDLNEQVLQHKASIILQFTNYLRRLESVYLDTLNNLSNTVIILDVIKEALSKTGLEYPLYINSSLFEVNMLDDVTDTFLEQTLIESDLFYKNSVEYDDAYTMLEKILKSFDAFLYMYDQKFIIERWDNIVNEGNWVYFPYGENEKTGIGTASLKKQVNIQAKDLCYTESSQIVRYNSGANTFKVQLNDELLSSLVNNNFKHDMLTLGDPPAVDGTIARDFFNTIETKKWYIHDDTEFRYNGIDATEQMLYFRWQVGSGTELSKFKRGLHYKFMYQYDSDSGDDPVLNITFKFAAGIEDLVSTYKDIRIRFSLQVNIHGDIRWVYLSTSGDCGTSNSEEFNTMIFSATGDADPASAWRERTFSLKLVGGFAPYWATFGNTVKFLVNFRPVEYYYLPTKIWKVARVQSIGGIKVSASPVKSVDNEIAATLNQSFNKEKTKDMYLFDLPDFNYANGLRYSDTAFTTEWTTDGIDFIPLSDVLIKSKFNRYCKTTRELSADVFCEKYLKPFTIITDNNIYKGLNNILFLLTYYDWNVCNDRYRITADEYPDETIILNE